jgi:predicted Zn finger-like uncharacterized protein
MQFICPECSTSYRIAGSAIGPEGRKVKCARCGHNWLQQPEAAETGQEPQRPEEEEIIDPTPPAAEDEAVAIEADSAEEEPGAEEAPPADATESIDEESIEAEVATSVDEEQVPPPVEAAEIAEDIEPPVRRTRRPPPKPAKSAGMVAWAALVLLVAVAALGGFFYRAEIVKAWPPAGKFYRTVGIGMPARELGLEISNVNYSQERREGKTLLLITGEISNVGIDEQKIPEVRVSLYDDNKRKLNHWTAPLAKDKLAPGEKVAFSTRMMDPPKTARDFAVTFVLKR